MRSFSPLARTRGVSPSHVAKCLADLNCVLSPTAATSAVAVMGPTPGAKASRWLASLALCQAMIRLQRVEPQLQIIYLIEQTRESLTRLVGQRLGRELAHPRVQITDAPFGLPQKTMLR
jgi:hypothetical protein